MIALLVLPPGILASHNGVGNLAAPPELQHDLQSLTFCYKVLQPKPITWEETWSLSVQRRGTDKQSPHFREQSKDQIR